jgi:hypothetical protein
LKVSRLASPGGVEKSSMRRIIKTPWFWLALQAAILFGVYDSIFRLVPEGSEAGQRTFIASGDGYLLNSLAYEVSWDSFVKSLASNRTFAFPLVLHAVHTLTPSWDAWPLFEIGVRLLAVTVFYVGLRAVGVSVGLATALSSTLLYTELSCWSSWCRSMIASDPLAESLAIATVGLLLRVLGGPQSPLAWGGLALGLFLTYQTRPAYLFLVGLIPLLGVLLMGPVSAPGVRVHERLRVGGSLVAVSVLPYLGWCTLRWFLVGHFGLVSYGGYSFVHISGLFLSAKVIPELPPEVRPLARAVLEDRARLSGWQSPLDAEGWIDPELVADEAHFADLCIQSGHKLYFRNALKLYGSAENHIRKGYGQDFTTVNHRLAELAVALVRARPWFYAQWLVTAFEVGIVRMVTTNHLFQYLVVGLGVLLGVWHTTEIRRCLRTGPGESKAPPGLPGNSRLGLNIAVLIAVGFALAKFLEAFLAALPEASYLAPAGGFLPAAGVIAMGVWHTGHSRRRRQSGPAGPGAQPNPPATDALGLNITVRIAVSFGLAKLLQVILVAPPEGRYMAPAGVFLPAVAVAALFSLGHSRWGYQGDS